MKHKKEDDNSKELHELSEAKLKKAMKMSEVMGKHYSEENVKKIERKKGKYSSSEAMTKIKDKVDFLWDCLKSHKTPTSMKLAIFGAFAYLVSPVDVVPDFIPGIGVIDDAAVLYAVWKTSFPYLKEVFTDVVDKVGTSYLNVTLKKTYKRTLINGIFVLAMNILATLICCFDFFGPSASKYVASFIFIGIFSYSFVRFILFIINYGKITVQIVWNVLKQRNVIKGVAEFVRKSDEKVFKVLSKFFIVVDVVNKYGKMDIPTMERIINHFLRKVTISVLFYAVLYSVYLVFVFWILKPFILLHFTNMHSWEFLFFPVVQVLTVI